MSVHNLAEYISIARPVVESRVTNIRSQSAYTENVLNAPANELVVLDCFATWCGPCKVIAPTIAQYAIDYPNVKFVKVDVDEVPAVAQELGVRAMPTFFFFKNGEKLTEVVGANARAIKASIDKLA